MSESAPEFVELHWTAGSIDEARLVCRYLVQEHLVACAQLIPWVESVYMWDNQLETAQESKVVLKTHVDRVEDVKQAILDNAKYEVPEITVHAILSGNSEYLDWMRENTMAPPSQTVE